MNYSESEKKQIMLEADLAIHNANVALEIEARQRAQFAKTANMAGTSRPAPMVPVDRDDEDEKITHDGDSVKAISQKVALGIQNILARKEAANFGAAQELFFARNPATAREYVDANG